MPMRPLAAQVRLGHTANSGRSGGRVVLVIRPRYHHCARHVNIHSTLSCGATATIHTFINQVSTAQSALRLAETRGRETKSDDIEELLDLAEACLRQARSLIAASARSAAHRHSPTFAA